MAKPRNLQSEMASCLFRAHVEAGLDLGDWRAVEAWLAAAMYTRGQINIHGRDALESARAKVQIDACIDAIACLFGIACGIPAIVFALIGFSGPSYAASVLTAQACADGGDLAMFIGGAGITALIFSFILWLRDNRVARRHDPERDGAWD